MLFQDRSDAAKKLIPLLDKYRGRPDVIVLGLPRGGVVTAYEIAHALGVALDITCARKIGAPFNPELAIGAVTESGGAVFNEDLLLRLSIPDEMIQASVQAAQAEALRRVQTYRKGRPPLVLQDKVVILVDDGLATGATMKAAIQSVISMGALHIVVAVPVSPPDTLEEISALVDEVACLYAPYDFMAVGQFYRRFDQTTDDEVMNLLKKTGSQK